MRKKIEHFNIQRAVTLREVNEGCTLIPAEAGKSIRVDSIRAKVEGTWKNSGDIIELVAYNVDEAVTVAYFFSFSLVHDALLTCALWHCSPGVNIGVDGFFVPLSVGSGVSIKKKLYDWTYGLEIIFDIDYSLLSEEQPEEDSD